MGQLSRRDFLRAAAAAAAAAPVVVSPWTRALAAETAGMTTLERTIGLGKVVGTGTKGSYRRLVERPGEPHLVREELARRSSSPIKRAISFVHSTDTHVVDAQSTARVEFLDRFADQQCSSAPLNAAQRAHETLTVQVADAMNQRLRKIKRGPVTGTSFRFAVCTGDNIDNEQLNELRWFIDAMDGGKLVVPDSGAKGLYEGVQAADWGDQEYWHPDPGVPDKYKTEWGFPSYPGMLADALEGFTPVGVGIPWWQTFGNHDGLLQGNAPRTEAFDQIAVGPLKISGPPPGVNPCDPWPSIPVAPMRPVTADATRRIVRRREYVEQMFVTTGTPKGHGFSQQNRADGTAYYVRDDVAGYRFITLDTVNPGGFADGSIGAAQLAWLEQRLIEASSRYYAADGTAVTTGNPRRWVVLFSHHGIRSLNNPILTPDPDPQNAAANDLPRVMGDEVEALLHRFPNVIAWVNGHTHDNVVEARPDPAGVTGGFWDIGTAAHVDWPAQSRIVEVAERKDGSISIWCTVVDHEAPANPAGAATRVLRLASISRELEANDPQLGHGTGAGGPEDRNVELVLRPG
jgi:metallophosphoesterase (TIGR03767 family)